MLGLPHAGVEPHPPRRRPKNITFTNLQGIANAMPDAAGPPFCGKAITPLAPSYSKPPAPNKARASATLLPCYKLELPGGVRTARPVGSRCPPRVPMSPNAGTGSSLFGCQVPLQGRPIEDRGSELRHPGWSLRSSRDDPGEEEPKEQQLPHDRLFHKRLPSRVERLVTPGVARGSRCSQRGGS